MRYVLLALLTLAAWRLLRRRPARESTDLLVIGLGW